MSNIDERGIVRELPARPLEAPCTPASLARITLHEYEVEVGEEVTLSATGTVSSAATMPVTIGPNGIVSTASGLPRVLDGANYMALLARVGEGPYFVVGSATTFVSPWAGRVTFAVNDELGQFCNNRGSFFCTLGRNLGTDPLNPDTDGDGVIDGLDALPLDPTETVDTDGDGIGDNADPDDDGDGLDDLEELAPSLGLAWTVAAAGDAAAAELFTGRIARPDIPFPLNATGSVTNLMPAATTGPAGATSVSVHSINVLTREAPFLALVGRLGQSDYRSLGEKGSLVTPADVRLLSATIHIGDTTVPHWVVPAPQATEWVATFTLRNAPIADARLTASVFNVGHGSSVYVNGQLIGALEMDNDNPESERFIRSVTVIPRAFLVRGQNQIAIVPRYRADRNDVDDILLADVKLECTPSRWKSIYVGARHVGNRTITEPGWLPQEPDGEEVMMEFALSEVPPGPATLYFERFNVGSGNPVLVNGSVIGTIPPSTDPGLNDYRATAMTVPPGLLAPGYNTVVFKAAPRGGGAVDEYLVRRVSLATSGDIPPELVLAVNDVRETFGASDNSGAYQARIGSGTPSNPLKVDTDDDGMDDKFEIDHGFDPNNPDDAEWDTDGDGLSNVGEKRAGTNPRKYDTDGDGMSDGYEVANGLNPRSFADRNTDKDGDGLSNFREYQLGTRADLRDTDGDGIHDGQEVQYGTDPLDPLDPRPYDANGDGVIDALDIFSLARHWRRPLQAEMFHTILDGDGDLQVTAVDALGLIEARRGGAP